VPPSLPDRYTPIRPLGAGAQGSVWLARDVRAGGREVAIKRLPASQLAAAAHEFSLLHRLRHPGLAAVLELERAPDGALLLVCEVARGEPIDRWAPGRPRDAVLTAVSELLAVLDFLHRRGVVHRDLKEENVLVGPAGLKLVDLGLSVEGEVRDLSGPCGYLAPELYQGARASARSDLYAVGVLLCRLLLGRAPFPGTPSEVVAAQLEGEPRLSGEDPIVPIVRRLLARDPAQRPASAAEALAALAGLAGANVGDLDRSLAARGLPTPALEEREALLAEGRRALRAVREGEGPAVVLIVGRRGEGRTRLCDELAAEAALLGLNVRRGLDRPRPGAPTIRDPQAEAALARADALEAIRGLARDPTCILLDGPSAASAPLVAEALVAEHALPVALVVAVEAGGELAPLLAPRSTARLQLGPLGRDGTRALCASMLPASFLTPELPALLHARTGGNPRLACALLRSAVERWLASDARTPASLVALLEPGEGALALEALVAGRAQALPAATRRVAAAVALFEAGAREAVLAPLLDVDAPALRATLAALLDQGILDPAAHGGEVAIAGSALAHALLDALAPEERGVLVARAHALLEGEGAPPRERAQVALRAAGRGDGPLLLAGADDARLARELPLAARLYRAAARALPPGPDRLRALLADAELAVGLGQLTHAREVLREALAAADDRDARRALLRALVDVEVKAGRAGEALRELESCGLPLTAPHAKALLYAGQVERAAAVAAGAADDPALAPAERALALHLLGLARYTAGDLEGAQAPLEQALALVGGEGADPLERARITNSLALLHQRRGELGEARRRYLECLELALALQHLPYQATLLQNLASVAEREGDHVAALARYQESLEAARRFGGVRETAQVLHNLARLRGHLGQHAEAFELVRRSLALARSASWTGLEAQNLLLEAELRLDLAELDEGEALLERATASFAAAADAAGGAEAELARARLWLLREEPERAAALARRLVEAAAGNRYVTLHARIVLGWAELERGHPGEARRQLSEAWRGAGESGERDPELLVHALLARVHDALGDPATSRAHAELARALAADQLARLPAELRSAYAAHPARAALVAPAAPGERPSAQDAELLAALTAINRELNAEAELDRLLERIIDHAVALVQAERGFLLLARGGALYAEVARNLAEEPLRPGDGPSGLSFSRSLAEQVLATGRPLVTLDAMEDDRFRSSLSVHDLRLRSVLCVPLSVRRQVRGALYLDDRLRREAFQREHQLRIEALAEQAGLAIGLWELLEENRRRRAELEEKGAELERVNLELRRSVEAQSVELDELSSLARAQRGELEGRYRYEELVGRGPAMRELFRLIDRAKDSLAPVLVQGESGTGKELCAKAVHYSGPRRAAPFVSVNCGALPPTLLESELFGFERGAFTGAERLHRGLFERADGGTLFLDELGEMPPELQVKLLRVLQEKRFARVGGEVELASDFRLIAASNRDLAARVREGAFREDLYYRIAVIELRLPPLRERKEEIPLLVEHLLARHAAGRSVRVSRAAMRRLLDHDWPGNVRELENQILRALALGGATLAPEDFSLAGPTATSTRPEPAALRTLREAGAELERTLVLAALERSKGSVTEAARELGITRVGLHKLLRRLGLGRAPSVS
jgi:transcriptional regulator with GAF, ATPase, and Fis domain